MNSPTWNTHIYGSHPVSSTYSPEELEERLSEDNSKVLSMYDAGVPFFTKEALRDVYQQLKQATEYGQKVSVRALDGAVVDFKILTGYIQPRHTPDIEYVM